MAPSPAFPGQHVLGGPLGPGSKAQNQLNMVGWNSAGVETIGLGTKQTWVHIPAPPFPKWV